MKILYLLRHAHTTSAAPPLMGDHERILSSQGTEEALSIGRFMQEHDMRPDFVLSSSAVRTIQTARLIFGVLFHTPGAKIDSRFDRCFYLAPAEHLLSEIQMIDDSIQRLMVVSHNPGVADLAFDLNGQKPHPQINQYAPGTLTAFTADCQHWKDFSAKTAKLAQVFVPHDI